MSNFMMLKPLRRLTTVLTMAILMEEPSDLMLLLKGIDLQEAIDSVGRVATVEAKVATVEVRVALADKETQEILLLH
jgi:hypothetical protein